MVQTQFSFIGEQKAAYLDDARAAAKRLLRHRQYITTDDVRAICPVPHMVNPKIMGSVFKHPDFESTGQYVPSRRSEAHGRPIQKFKLKQPSLAW